MSDFESDLRSRLETRKQDLAGRLENAGEWEVELGRIEAALACLDDEGVQSPAKNGGASKRGAAPAAPNPSAAKSQSAKSQPANGKLTADAVFGALAEGPKSAEQIRKILGGSSDDLRKRLGELLTAGRVTKTGVRRATKYAATIAG